MNAEIEAKLKVDSLQYVEESLSKLGAEFIEQQHHIDYYFDDDKSTFEKNDKCLRLRQLSTAEGESFFLTYKGPKQKDNFKKRIEIETRISSLRSAENLLSVLGYNKKLVVEKKRRIWQLASCLVALDELPGLGCFVEIEGADDSQIAEAQKKLGLEDLKHIAQSYAELIVKKR